MLILPTLFLPLDKTGLNPANRQTGEAREAPVSAARLVRMKYGAFFTRGFVLYSVDENSVVTELTHGTHYRFVEFFQNTSAALGQEIYGGLLITDPLLPNNYLVDYSALGGPENADNLAIAEALRNVHGAGYTIDYDRLIDVPDTFAPAHHYTDLATLYGLEYLTAIFTRVTEAIRIRPYTQRAKVLDATRDLRLDRQVKLAAFEQVLRDHTRNLNNPHGDNASTIGLNLMRNVGFKTTFYQGVTYEGYVSPSGTRNATTPVVGNLVNLHAQRKDNPHQDTKHTLNLGYLLNIPIHTGYSSVSTGGYIATYSNGANTVYLGPYSVRSYVGERTSRYASEELNMTLQSFYEGAQTAIATATDRMNQFNQLHTFMASKIQLIQSNSVLNFNSYTQNNKEDTEYRLLNQNSCYAQLLTELVTHRKGTIYNTVSTMVPIPRKLRGLSMWLDFSDTTTMVFEGNDVNADRKIRSIHDKVDNLRKFSQSAASAQPLYVMSQDAQLPESPGLVKNRVARFEQGVQHLSQTGGTQMKLMAGGTLIILAKTNDDTSSLYPLMLASTNSNVSTTDGVCIHGTNKRVAVVTQTGSFTLNTPNESTASGKYVLSVISLNGTDYNRCWMATTKGAFQQTAKRGIEGIAMSPAGLVLNQIGINKSGSVQKGELAEILYYEQQLSVSEIQSIVSYLSSKWSNASMTLDLGYVKTAFSAHSL